MTVTWRVKVAKDWYDGCIEKEVEDCFEKAFKKFGVWVYSVSYRSCAELRDRVKRYLESKGVDLDEYLNVIGFFCGILQKEINYDKRLYELLKEALENIEKHSGEDIIKYHARSLVRLITTAEKFKSGIICSG